MKRMGLLILLGNIEIWDLMKCYKHSTLDIAIDGYDYLMPSQPPCSASSPSAPRLLSRTLFSIISPCYCSTFIAMGPIDDPTVQGVNQEPKISMNFNNETQQVETFLRTPGNPTPYKVPGTNEEWGNFIDQYMPIQIPKPTPPDQLSQDTLDLYRKAINEPNSLTQEETLIHTRMGT